MFEYITLDQIRHIVDRSMAYNDIKEFLAVPFFQIEDLSLYIQNKDTQRFFNKCFDDIVSKY